MVLTINRLLSRQTQVRLSFHEQYTYKLNQRQQALPGIALPAAGLRYRSEVMMGV